MGSARQRGGPGATPPHARRDGPDWLLDALAGQAR